LTDALAIEESGLQVKAFAYIGISGGNGNLWWTGAISVGIRYAMAQALATGAVLVINDDLEVNPDYLVILYGLFNSMPRTLIGSVTVDIKNPGVIINGRVVVNMNWLRVLQTGLTSCRMWRNLILPSGSTCFT
jgi:hypothetical protein